MKKQLDKERERKNNERFHPESDGEIFGKREYPLHQSRGEDENKSDD